MGSGHVSPSDWMCCPMRCLVVVCVAIALEVALALVCGLSSRAYADDIQAARFATVDLPPIVFSGDGLEETSEFEDNDELFAGYVNRVFGENVSGGVGRTSKAEDAAASISLFAQKVTRGSLLSGLEKAVYDELVMRIDDVAAGEEPNTIIEIPLSSLNVSVSYTAADLGLNSVFDPDNPSTIAEEAIRAMSRKISVALSDVMHAALCDHPYDLYWYDKVSGIILEPPSLSAFGNGEEELIEFVGSLWLKLCVSADYSEDGAVATYVADTLKTGAASRAAAVAQGIVADHAAETDYSKLHSYLEEVAKLTDYNHEVAEADGNAVYGDPWQIISVFDGDSSTKVVCEGYAKAFQYLCDCSTFSDGDLACNSVSGDMYGGTGSGPHMWNIVAMGGKNYLVDVTNNDNFSDDPNAVAHTPNDELFMTGAEGGVDEGYYVEWPNAVQGEGLDWISYYYDEDTLRFYDEAELRLSSNTYLADQAGGQSGDDPDTGDEPGGGSDAGGQSGSNEGDGASGSVEPPVQKVTTIADIVVNAKTVSAKALKKAIGANARTVTTITLGPKVKKISKGALKSFPKVKTLIVKTKKLKKSSVKGALKGSKVKTVRVQIGSAKVNKKYVKKYKKLFTKKVCGRKAKVK